MGLLLLFYATHTHWCMPVKKLKDLCLKVLQRNPEVVKRPKASVSDETISQVLFLNLTTVENLRETEQALRRLKRKNVDSEKAWKKLVERKFGIRKKPDNCSTWRGYYKVKEREAEERKEKIRQMNAEIKEREIRQQQERKTKVIQPSFSRSMPAAKRRRGSSSVRTVSRRPGGIFGAPPTQSILPKRR